MVRIPSFHLGEPGSIPGLGIGSIAPSGKGGGATPRDARHRFAGSNPATATGESV